ncbi:MAG: VWA domain-containing protein [Proteobacteria bacterium]|nr:VWA domain-containing protein [Pseudomonadota bacterium]
MSFSHPSYLFLFWLIPALIFFYIYAFRKKDRLIKAFCGEMLASELVPAHYRGRQKLKAALIIISFVFLITALMQPRWGFHWEDIKRRGVDILIAIDVSQSMLAEDIKPSRLERAKRKVYDLAQMLEGDRIGLIAFAGTSFVQCPLTLDYGAFKIFLDYLNPDLIPVPGTAIGNAIRKAVTSFNQHERTSKALIIITDGEDHEGNPLETAQEAKKQGIRIFTIGVGQEGGAPIPMKDGSGGFKKDERGEMVLSRLDETTLQKIALETGGSYVRSVTGDMDLDKIYREDIKGKVEKKELRSTRKKRWEERFPWFIFIAAVLLSLEFFLRERK